MTCRCCGQPLEPWEADFCEGCASLFVESGSIFRILEKDRLTSRQTADKIQHTGHATIKRLGVKAMKIERAELEVMPNVVQVEGEEGRYNVERGFVIEARVRGRRGHAIFAFQGVFETYRKADEKMWSLIGKYSNGFNADIDTDSEVWRFVGATY